MAEIKQTERVERVMKSALFHCNKYRHEFVMPEHLLLALTEDSNFNAALSPFCSPPSFANKIENYLEGMEIVPIEIDYKPELSIQMDMVIDSAVNNVELSEAESIDIPHLVKGLLELKDS